MTRKRKRDRRGRPETSGTAGEGAYYDETETKRYSRAEKKTGIQDELAYRALHFMHSHTGIGKQSGFFLNVGIGSGSCQNTIDKYSSKAPFVIGTDLSIDMLRQGQHSQLEFQRDLLSQNFCQSLPFRDAPVFDGIFSISALQWLCIREDTDDLIVQFMAKALKLLHPGGVLVAQFFPNRPSDCGRLQFLSVQAGFTSNVVMDMPHNNKSKRFYLILQRDAGQPVPRKLSAAASCPCAWPQEGTCSLALHMEHSRAWSHGSVKPINENYEEQWLGRCQRLHTLHAKKMMAMVQQLWIRSSDNPEGERKKILKHKRIESFDTVVEMNWEERYRRRARLEAWSLGTKAKAEAKHLGKFWDEIQTCSLKALVKDGEEEVICFSQLPCFAHADLFLLRTKRKTKK